jgi:hypothetical protein
MKKTSTFFRTIILLFFLSLSQLAFNQAPKWIWNSPLAVIPSSLNGGGISVYAMIDRPGTIYYEVVNHGSGAPPIDSIVKGKDAGGFTPVLYNSIQIGASDYKSGFKSIELKPLTPTAEFDIYFVAKDTATIPHFQTLATMLDLVATPGSAMTFWNNDFEQWNDSLNLPLYYYNWRQNLTDVNASYSRDLGETGYGFKTTVTKATSSEKRVLIMNPDPYPFGLSTNTKYHASLRLKATRANSFSVVYNQWAYFNDFFSGGGTPIPGTSVFTTVDTLMSTNWETYSIDFYMTTANRFKPRWNINKTATAQNGDNIIIDNFYLKNASEAPVWWNGNPVIANVKFNKFDVNLKLDEPGTVFYVLLPKDATAPTVAEVLAGTASGGSAAILNGSVNAAIGFNTYSATLSGLSENINYDLYLVAQNKESSPTAQSTVTKLSALTSSFPGPFARAGGKIWTISGYTVTLDGTGSIGTPLTYNWIAPGTITLSSNTASKPTFTAPSVTDTVVYPIILIVNDGVNDSPPDTAMIYVVQDYVPMANGGGNKTVDGASNVSLDGSQSKDPNGNALIYSWTVPAGITVSKTDTAVISFVAPLPIIKTSYKFILMVNDGKLDSSPDTIVLTVNPINIKPTANAGSDQIVDAAAHVVLNGSLSFDPNGDTLIYYWTIPEGVNVIKTDTIQISFTAPSPVITTVYTFLLMVNDGHVFSDPDTVNVTVLGIVGIHSPSIQNIQLYPNPVNSNLNIRLSANWNINSTVRIFNALGSLVMEKKMNGLEYQLDLNSIPAGVYFIEIKDGENTVNRKLIKR